MLCRGFWLAGTFDPPAEPARKVRAILKPGDGIKIFEQRSYDRRELRFCNAIRLPALACLSTFVVQILDWHGVTNHRVG